MTVSQIKRIEGDLWSRSVWSVRFIDVSFLLISYRGRFTICKLYKAWKICNKDKKSGVYKNMLFMSI